MQRIFFLVSFEFILTIESLFYSIFFLLLRLCHEFGIDKKYALFGLNVGSLKFGKCRENYILNIWGSMGYDQCLVCGD